MFFFFPKQIGPKWEHVVDKCSRGRYQPLLLLYTNPNASPISTDTAPKKKVMAPGFGTPTKGLYSWLSVVYTWLEIMGSSLWFIEQLDSFVTFYLSFMDNFPEHKLTLLKFPLLWPLNYNTGRLSFFLPPFWNGLIRLCILLIKQQKVFNQIMVKKVSCALCIHNSLSRGNHLGGN